MNLENEILQINLDDIIPNRFQPRIAFDEQGLKELADSIKEHGIIQPLVLRKLGNKYEIIAGERRYKAATLAGLVTVPAVISNIDDNKSAEVALVENIQRRDLTPIEEAKSYKSLLDRGYLTQEQLAKRMGVSQPAIANKLRLLNLDEEVQQALLAEKISERHARALLQVEDKQKQKEWLNRIVNERLTVRQLDQEIKKSLGEDTSTTDDVPLVSLTPSIEEIRAGAQDLNAPIENKPFDFMDSSASFNPIKMEMEKDIPEEPKIETLSDGKFFNFGGNEPLNMQMPEVSTTNVFNPSNDIEVIDMPAMNAKKEEVIEEFKPTTETLAPQESNIDLSSHNKFFTPFMDATEPVIPDILTPKKEEIVDPMDNVRMIDPNEEVTREEIVQNNLTEAINKTRSAINDLKAKGFKVETEELDLTEKYQIIINIEK